MSDEVKVTEEKECKCFCKSEGVRNFVTIALGTFVGVYSALSLFTAIHKPPMIMPPCPFAGGFGNPAPFATPCHFKHNKHHFNQGFKGDKGEFHKEFKGDRGPAPFDKDRNKD